MTWRSGGKAVRLVKASSHWPTEFPGSQFEGESVPELAKLVDGGLNSILDLVFLTKGVNGSIVYVKLDQLDQLDYLRGNGRRVRRSRGWLRWSRQ